MSYRPICDTWILARPKVRYHGAYPSGFLSRARELLGVHPHAPVLHVCGGKIREYPFRGLGKNDKTVDLSPDCRPDFLMDVRRLGVGAGDLFPEGVLAGAPLNPCRVVELTKELLKQRGAPPDNQLWPAALIDRPYTEEDAAHYTPGAGTLPEAGDLLRRALSVVVPGGRVGILDYIWPRPPKWARLVACVGVIVGYANRMRVYSVFERMLSEAEVAQEPAPEGLDEEPVCLVDSAAITTEDAWRTVKAYASPSPSAGDGYDPAVLDDVSEEERNAVCAAAAIDPALGKARGAAAEDF
jgi:hypothetical protein